MSDTPLIRSLRAAVEAVPGDVTLRLHLAEQLLAVGDGEGAAEQAATALQHDPMSGAARDVLGRALGIPGERGVRPAEVVRAVAGPEADLGESEAKAERLPTEEQLPTTAEPKEQLAEPERAQAQRRPEPEWTVKPEHPGTEQEAKPAERERAEPELAEQEQVKAEPEPAKAEQKAEPTEPELAKAEPEQEEPKHAGAEQEAKPAERERAEAEAQDAQEPVPVGEVVFDWAAAEEELGFLDVEEGRITLKDVGGLKAVKERLEAAFLAPMRNPELRRLYGKNTRGGLMLYGPPGCGKTFMARAVAGELGAKFISVTLSDVLDMYIGQSERNLHEMFETARRNAPCVLFLDEVDALGQKRSQLRSSAMRGTVNQLLVELDDVRDSNEGVFVLAATNHPWDVDTALRRPGRFDRTLLVLPPDGEARQAILRYHLKGRHAEGIDIAKLAKRTEGYSGADLAHACDVAAEKALLDSVRSGRTRMIGAKDLEEALKEVRPSTGPWFAAARNVAMFANEGGQYDELLAYMKKHRLA
ncbi:tetratricopeptide repeat protein [Kutzneria sp. NPDC051319]|uniref:tetratricopeptide repeat protein n=1 Tax=Kutzneria sp. NPDC051319 TaxID=3155047 RepID=UPI003432BCAA